MSPPPTRIRCREIGAADRQAAVGILKAGFPNHEPDYWAQVWERLSAHRGVDGLPKYGYLLEADDRPVGVILVIFCQMPCGAELRVRCNVASWYVEAPYRSHATMLNMRAHTQRGITYLQLTPAPHVVPIIEALGYRRYCEGIFAAAALLCPSVPGARVRAVPADLASGDDLSRAQCELLLDHQRFGCLSLTCTLDGRRHPFVFARRWRRTRLGPLPYARLVYCRSLDEFARLAGPLGRFLALRGMPMVFVDANGPLPGVPGRFLHEGARYFKGAQAPGPGDLAYTELAMFGI